MSTVNRREFLRRAVAATAAVTSSGVVRAASPNNRVVLGIMGIHDRGMDLALEFGKRNDVEIRYLADPDSRLFDERASAVEKVNGKRPVCVQDFRRILDDGDVDALVVATPDHWHALATVLACQAGKDVYCEKPTSHSIWESRKMVEAARKYNRVVQVGTQNRSAEYVEQAIEYARSAYFGDIHFVRVMNSKLRDPMSPASDGATPDGVDYDLWLGPAPQRQFNPNHFHYSWHWFWAYGGGDLANDGVHQLDLARWVVNRELPKAVSSAGATYALNDTRDTPDTQTVTWEFDTVSVALEQTLWTPYMRKTPLELRDTGAVQSWPFNGTRIEVYGTKQFLWLGHGRRMGSLRLRGQANCQSTRPVCRHQYPPRGQLHRLHSFAPETKRGYRGRTFFDPACALRKHCIPFGTPPPHRRGHGGFHRRLRSERPRKTSLSC
ncbi:MAG: Gfo/Idh/MocA family oxidoreductase, partial [Candidatus Hydrogenedentales bacterium]